MPLTVSPSVHSSPPRRNFGLIVAVLLFPLVLSACGTAAPLRTVSEHTVVAEIATGGRVLVMRPYVTYERLVDEAPLDPAAYSAGLIESHIRSKSGSVLRAGNIRTVEAAVLKEVLSSSISDVLREGIPRLSRGMVGADAAVLLQALTAYDSNLLILVNYVDVKVGSGGSWNANSGAITTENSRSLFKSALISCVDGNVLWKGEVFLREIPTIKSERFIESLDLLYQGFPHSALELTL